MAGKKLGQCSSICSSSQPESKEGREGNGGQRGLRGGIPLDNGGECTSVVRSFA